jgi:hypothetical protein
MGDRLQRFLIRPLIVLLAAGVFVLVIWWFWLRPDSDWACKEETGLGSCVTQVVLQVPELLYKKQFSVNWALDIDNKGDTVVVGHQACPDDEMGCSIFESVVALYDVRSGEVVAELLRYYGKPEGAEERDVLNLESAVFSPDDSLVAVSRRVYDGSNDVAVFDTKSHERITDFFGTGDCRKVLGFSTDNRWLQCGSDIYDTATGKRLYNGIVYSFRPQDLKENSNTEVKPLVELGGICSRHRYCDRGGNWASIFLDKNGATVLKLDRDQMPGRFNSFSPSGELLLYVKELHNKTGWGWLGRDKSEATVSILKLQTGLPLATFQTDSKRGASTYFAWSEDSTRLAFITDGTLVVYEPPPTE